MNLEDKKNIIRGMITDFDGRYSTKAEMKAYKGAIASFIYNSKGSVFEQLELINFYEYCWKLMLEE